MCIRQMSVGANFVPLLKDEKIRFFFHKDRFVRIGLNKSLMCVSSAMLNSAVSKQTFVFRMRYLGFEKYK